METKQTKQTETKKVDWLIAIRTYCGLMYFILL